MNKLQMVEALVLNLLVTESTYDTPIISSELHIAPSVIGCYWLFVSMIFQDIPMTSLNPPLMITVPYIDMEYPPYIDH